ncbi:MAG TPA: FecR domain-containing protein [Puia sp.]|nr:FecR domain-containing protein [Puia sp.]
MEKSRILELLARKMGQVATPQELEELEGLLKKYPEYHFIKDTSEQMHMDFQPAGAQEEKALVGRNWDRLAEAMQESMAPERRGRVFSMFSRKSLRVAALVGGVALVAVIYYVSQRQKGDVTKRGELIARNGEKVRQLLPDSSFVWLNAGSHLEYASDYGKTRREVYLKGEAFFEVAPDRDRPFLVHAGRLTVRVLGTSFNVRSYEKDSTVETTLIKGKVEVQLGDGSGKKIILTPNEKLTVPSVAGSAPAGGGTTPLRQPSYTPQPLVHQSDTMGYDEVAWIDNKLVFWNEAFEQVAEKMERWYDVRIHFVRPELKKEYLSGTFEKETVEQALTILQMTTRFHFKKEGKDIYLQ